MRHKAYAESGMLGAAQDYEIGGMQLPCASRWRPTASSRWPVSIGGGGMLTSGNANLLMVHGTRDAAGGVRARTSSPAASPARCACPSRRPARACRDIATRAVPDGDDFESDPLGPRYRLSGNKMWISNGEHELTENIVHLVLAKIPGRGRQADSRHARHLALHRAEEAGRRRRPAHRRAQRRRAGRPEPQARLARHHQHAAQLRRGQVPVRERRLTARPAPSATWSASPARACAACST